MANEIRQMGAQNYGGETSRPGAFGNFGIAFMVGRRYFVAKRTGWAYIRVA